MVLRHLLEHVRRHLRIARRAALFLAGVERALKFVQSQAEHHVAKHLQEPAVAVPCKPRILRRVGQPLYRRVVQTEVQHRIHHARHRHRRTGAHGHQQRILGIAQRLACRRFQRRERGRDLVHQAVGQGVEPGVRVAGDGRQRESRRHRQADVAHLREIGALAAEQALLARPTF